MKNNYTFIFLSVALTSTVVKAMDDVLKYNTSRSSSPNSSLSNPRKEIPMPLFPPFKKPSKHYSPPSERFPSSNNSQNSQKEEIMELVDSFEDLGECKSQKFSPALLESLKYNGSTDLPPDFFRQKEELGLSNFCVVEDQTKPPPIPNPAIAFIKNYDPEKSQIVFIENYSEKNGNPEILDQRVLEALAFFKTHKYGVHELEQLKQIFARSEFEIGDFEDIAKLLFNSLYVYLLDNWEPLIRGQTFTLELLKEEGLLFLLPSKLFNELAKKNIKGLQLSQTMLYTLPRNIGELSNLEEIQIFSSNKLTLPLEMIKLNNLKKLGIWGNSPENDSETRQVLETLKQKGVSIDNMEPKNLMTESFMTRPKKPEEQQVEQTYMGLLLELGMGFFK